MKPQIHLLFGIVLICLCSMPTYGQRAPSPTIDYKDHRFSVKGLSLPTPAAGSSKPPEWTYFWEFGDGHYSSEPNPQYCFESVGLKTIRVSLVPHYSHDSTRTLTQAIFISSNCTSDGCRKLGACGETNYEIDKLVAIVANADNELVPENDIQFVVHYALPGQVAGEGTLFLLFNGNEIIKEVDFAPLVFRRTGRDAPRLYGATRLSNPKQRLREQSVSAIPSPSLGYSVEGFDCRLAAGQPGRLYVTMGASASLDTVALKKKGDALTTQVRAIWIPRGQPFSELKMTDNYELKMLSVHDPNRIRILTPKGKASYTRQSPESFEIEIEFQNLGGKAVQRIEAAVPWPENMDTSTVEITHLNPYCSRCDEGPPAGSPRSCFQLDWSKLAITGEVRFIFHNVLVVGKRQPGVKKRNQKSKGSIRFTVRSNRKQRQTTPWQAFLTFNQDPVFKTRQKSKRWRHRGVGVRAGYHLGGAPAEYSSFTDNPSTWLQLGVSYRNSSLLQGFTPFAGWEMTLAGMGFENEQYNQLSYTESSERPFLLTRETVKLQSLDLQAFTEVRVGGVLALALGAGPSIPLSAEGKIEANLIGEFELSGTDFDVSLFEPETITAPIFDQLLAYEGNNPPFTEVSSFGLLDSRSPTSLIGEDISSNFGIGTIVSATAELGLLNNVTLGLRQNFRIYPNSYRGRCLKINNQEAYLRVNLFSLK